MISVIIPYVEDRGFLNEAILSLASQTYKDFEIIKQKGKFTQGMNINIGLKKARGEYIKILHDDDILPPNSLADLLDGIQGHDWVCGDMLYFGDALNCPVPGNTSSMEGPPELSKMIQENYIAGGTTLYRRDVLLRVGGYNEDLHTGEEYELHLRLLSMGHECAYIPKVVHRYRLHEHNKSYFMGPGEKKKRREFIRAIADKFK